MPRPQITFDTHLKRIPTHSGILPGESAVPWQHYRRSANDAWNLLLYFERNIDVANVYAAPYNRHYTRLATMVLLGLVESFERFLKEIAAECIDAIAGCVIDDRFDEFSIKGSQLAAHFAANNLGKALCEPLTWCDCKDTNDRFRSILSDPWTSGNFYVFPLATQQPAALRGRIELMKLVWQLRHTIAHNTGVITSADALKFRLLMRQDVDSPRLLEPTKIDVWYVKLFLDGAAEDINREVGNRLAVLLTLIHGTDPTLFQPADKAQHLADKFAIASTVAGVTVTP